MLAPCRQPLFKVLTSQSLQEPAYLHAPNMYNITAMKHRKLKFGAACLGIVGAGIGVPYLAVHWQISKAAA